MSTCVQCGSSGCLCAEKERARLAALVPPMTWHPNMEDRCREVPASSAVFAELDATRAALTASRAAERARIVEWLRAHAKEGVYWTGELADAIERGEATVEMQKRYIALCAAIPASAPPSPLSLSLTGKKHAK